MWVGTCHQKGSNFQNLSGTGVYSIVQNFLEEAQIYLSGKGSLLVWKGAVKLPLPRMGVPYINKCPELVLMMQ